MTHGLLPRGVFVVFFYFFVEACGVISRIPPLASLKDLIVTWIQLGRWVFLDGWMMAGWKIDGWRMMTRWWLGVVVSKIFYLKPRMFGVSWSDLTSICFKWVGNYQTVVQLSNEKRTPGCLGYVGDHSYTTQLCWDYENLINQQIRIPIKQPVQWKARGVFFFRGSI